MTYRSGLLSGILLTLVVLGSAAACWRLWTAGPSATAQSGAAAAPPPATVAKVIKEDQLQTITLNEAAERQLSLDTAKVVRKSVRRVRTYGGEVTVPAGRTILVSAPLGGMLKAAAGALPQPGQTVRKGQPVVQLFPLLTPEGRATLAASRVEADGQVKSFQAQHDAAQIAVDRAKRVLREGAGSQRQVDEAQAQLDVANKALEGAIARRDLLAQVVGEMASGTAAPITIESPQDGLLRNLTALPGQTVPGGAALFEVADLSRVWVRVPVYAGDRPDLDPEAPATIGNLAARPGDAGRTARPVGAPPSANPLAGTVDLYYEVDNADGALVPGQRIAATIPLKSGQDSLTVPWSAVVYDIHGGTWVYERTQERTYIRRRVVVRFVSDGNAVLASGPAAGTEIVVAGAAELFGTEVGFSK